MFFDEAKIVVRSGTGGDGCVGFRREKYVALGGPNGGHGGRGGHVFLRVSPHVNTLVNFSRQRHFIAEPGIRGQGSRKHGANGEDLYVDVPLGTVVKDADTGEMLGDLAHEGDILRVAVGGRGGRGNESFKSSTRQAPGFAEKGEVGQDRTLYLELKLIADVGLLGKPNAGKSTLLSRVSAARPKIASYPFTTLQPQLGVVESDTSVFVMADIPGLIEGAHEGTGLGLEFLRHVERTRLLVHLVDGSAPNPIGDWREINRELGLYSAKLAAKPQIVVINKVDLTEVRDLVELMRDDLEREMGPVLAVSGVTGEGVQHLLRVVAAKLEELPREEPEPVLYVHRPDEVESVATQVTCEAEGVYRIAGEEIERLARMTDWNNIEGIERFERILHARGVAEQAEAEGIQLGDTVFIGEIELEWR